MIAVLSWSLATAAPAATPPPDNPVFDPANERFIERDRRAKGAYRIALVLGAVGVSLELVGGLTDQRDVYALGGTMEAVAAPSMAVSSLLSARALGRLADQPSPAFGWTATGFAGADLALSLTAASNSEQLNKLQRRRLVPIVLLSRALTVVGAVLQQRSNNRVRRRLGLRVRHGRSPRTSQVALSPWLGRESAGILLTLSDRGEPEAELFPWTSRP